MHFVLGAGFKDEVTKGQIIITLHDLIDISLDNRLPGLNDMIEVLGDLPQVCAEPNSTADRSNVGRPHLKIEYLPHLSSSNTRELERGVLIEQTALVDTKYGVRLQASNNHTFKLESNTACLEWLMWAIQLSLLKANATFVHTAGVEMNGQALLFPSWGGVGKTAIVKGFVKDLGWRLLGDDLVILQDSGVCFGYPKPMVLYPYHRNVFPEFFGQKGGPVAPTWLTSSLTASIAIVKPVLRSFPRALQFARRHNPQSVRARPSAIFGQNALARSGQLQTVIWLDRAAGITRPTLVSADDSLASRIIGSTLHELDQWCVNLTNVACGLGIISFQSVYPAWTDIVQSALQGVRGYILYIPSTLPVENVFEAVHGVLADGGVLNADGVLNGS